METLILKKDCKGYYSNTVDSIRIAVSESLGEWTGVIENLAATEDEDFLIFKVFGTTKKAVVSKLTSYIINQ